MTYISLFSSAGIGCFGFKQEGFECVATNELIERRLDVQKANNKCKYDSGYVQGDISNPEVKDLLFKEIEFWRKKESVKDIDVLIATPPCQGMSVANHKKKSDEIIRNSLIVESIKLVSEIRPRVFVFENVPRFMTTICTDIDGVDRKIGEAIDRNLGGQYSIFSEVINFKEYGASSSRSRTLVIGVRRDFADHVSPIELFPDYKPEKTLREAIGHLPALKKMGAIDPKDIYHGFRSYPEHMESWIADLKEGESAFSNKDKSKIPHQIIDGKVVHNQQKNGDKYRRQIWDKVGPCVHTRNDQLASQNTIHPKENRVFSIRELMEMMTVPKSFNWTSESLSKLNAGTKEEKIAYLKKHEMNIRQSLGEAVPTEIFKNIARNYKKLFELETLNDRKVQQEIDANKLQVTGNLVTYLKENRKKKSFSTLSRIVELANSKRLETESFYTNKTLITEMLRNIPYFSGETISILEPSVGAGNFLPLIAKIFQNKTKVSVTVYDIDKDAIQILKTLNNSFNLPKNIEIEYKTADFLLDNVNRKFDLVIGNPPFAKSIEPQLLKRYRANSEFRSAQNTATFFLEKSLRIGKYVALVMPKFLLNTSEFEPLRKNLANLKIDAILDFGEKGFSGVLVETIGIFVSTSGKPSLTKVISTTENIEIIQKQSYITDKQFPYWIIYRNRTFDKVSKNMQFGIFDVFRDRQITNSLLNTKGAGYRVIKSRNIPDFGQDLIAIKGYDSFIDKKKAKNLAVFEYLDNEKVYISPNMTYKPRVIKKPAGTLVNGSAAILILKPSEKALTKAQMEYFSSQEYRDFYLIARNRQTRSLNIDSSSVFFFGRLKAEK